jgi:hypothetical protein
MGLPRRFVNGPALGRGTDLRMEKASQAQPPLGNGQGEQWNGLP